MGRNAIITGASGGIGRAVAERLARDGFSVVLNYAGNAAKAEEAVSAITAAGGRAAALKADVASATDVEQLFKQAGERVGTIDVVIHCAGIMPLRPIADGDVAMFDNVIATNLRGTFLVLAQAAQHVPPAAASSRSRAACWPSLFPATARTSRQKVALKGSCMFWRMNCGAETSPSTRLRLARWPRRCFSPGRRRRRSTN